MVSLSNERAELMIDNLGLVHSMSRRTPDPEEFFSIGQMALVKAANRVDLSRSAGEFQAYARVAIHYAFAGEYRRRALQREALQELAYIQETSALDDEPAEDTPLPASGSLLTALQDGRVKLLRGLRMVPVG